LHKRVTPKKAREMVQRKTVMGGGGLPGKFQIVQSKILQNVKYILSREIRQEELQNRS
jgi:hypothetical protein